MGGGGTPLPYDTATDSEGQGLGLGPGPGLGQGQGQGQGPGQGQGQGEHGMVHVEQALSTAEILRQRKLKKQRLRLAAERFNEKPLKADWIHFALSLGLLQVGDV